jgi:hypothetical protein
MYRVHFKSGVDTQDLVSYSDEDLVHIPILNCAVLRYVFELVEDTFYECMYDTYRYIFKGTYRNRVRHTLCHGNNGPFLLVPMMLFAD